MDNTILIRLNDIGDKKMVTKNFGFIKQKNFDKRFVNSNYISEQEVDRNQDWVLHHFNF